MTSRRTFLGAVAGTWAVSSATPGPHVIEGRILGADHRLGHRIRDSSGVTASPNDLGEIDRVDVVIVGSGVSGLSAAWRLRPAGLEVVALELEDFVGGTSTYGEDGAVVHPWGAHYLAAPNPEARAVLRLLDEMGTLVSFDAAGRPRFDERTLCHAPEERLFYRGQWFMDLVPHDALSADERREMKAFGELTGELTVARGNDGRFVFTIPVDQSSRDPAYLSLDRITMAEWLAEQGLTSPFLRWYVEYATRDDFGASLEDVSAWAALHYFCARKLATPELAGSHFLVWPEGNGRLVRALQPAATRIERGVLALGLTPRPSGIEVLAWDRRADRHRRLLARAVVLAVPAFIAARLWREAPVVQRASSPWLVANMHLSRAPDPDQAWDSVLYEAEGLGYVDASHQRTGLTDQTVWTYYRAYGGADVAATRHRMLGASWAELADGVLQDLSPAHPHLAEQVSRLDIMLWAHGMPRPRPGFLGGEPFQPNVLFEPRVAWAHVDQSGIAIFEEALGAGVRAAEALAPGMGVDLGETWL